MTAQIAKNRLLVQKILAFVNELQKPSPLRSSILSALENNNIDRARKLCDIALDDDWI